MTYPQDFLDHATWPYVGAHERRALCDGNGREIGFTWNDGHAEHLYAFDVLPGDLSAPRGAQAADIFERLADTLAAGGFTFDDVVRTWFYVDNVNEWYGEFNAARTAYFERHGVFTNFLPASTGIGHANRAGAAVEAGVYAMRPLPGGAAAKRLVDSPLQEPAMAYKASFSRAAEIETPDERILFISGTASIKPHSHDVAYVGDIDRQIDCTMTAVRAILQSRAFDWPDVCRAIVYVKKPEFLDAWKAWTAANGAGGDFDVIVADVCRAEWLFEIECDARSAK